MAYISEAEKLRRAYNAASRAANRLHTQSQYKEINPAAFEKALRKADAAREAYLSATTFKGQAN